MKNLKLIIYNSLHNKKIPVYGDGKNTRDWLYVEDNCKAIDLLLHRGKNGEIYNVGGGNEKENIEVAKLLIKKLGKSEDLIQYVKDRLAHDKRYAMGSTKIKRELNWKPVHQFKKGIEKTIKWYLDNTEWLKNCISPKYRSYYQQIYGEQTNGI